jgi:hypothetical protein
MTKTIIIEPVSCGDRCVNLRGLFEEKIKSGEIEIVAADSERGKKLIEAMNITDMSEPKIVMAMDAAPTARPAPVTPPAQTVV